MKEISFKNKVWMTRGGMTVYKCLIVLCVIYLLLSGVVILMEGVTFFRAHTVFAAIIITIWSRNQNNKSGRYIESECKIVFSDSEIKWEYPEIPLQLGKNNVHVIYTFTSDDIKNISVSNELKSVRVECTPLVEYLNNGKREIVDYRKNNKSCVLIAYNYDLKELVTLFGTYAKNIIANAD